MIQLRKPQYSTKVVKKVSDHDIYRASQEFNK